MARITSLHLLITIFLMQPRVLLTLFLVRVHCWFVVHSSFKMTHRSFSAKLLSRLSATILHCCMRLFPGAGLWTFPVLNFMRFPPARFSSLSKSLWMAAQSTSVSATHLLGRSALPWGTRLEYKLCHWSLSSEPSSSASFQLPHCLLI